MDVISLRNETFYINFNIVQKIFWLEQMHYNNNNYNNNNYNDDDDDDDDDTKNNNNVWGLSYEIFIYHLCSIQDYIIKAQF